MALSNISTRFRAKAVFSGHKPGMHFEKDRRIYILEAIAIDPMFRLGGDRLTRCASLAGIRMSENIQNFEYKLRKMRENSPSPQTCIQSHLLVMVAVGGPFLCLGTSPAVYIPEIDIKPFEARFYYNCSSVLSSHFNDL